MTDPIYIKLVQKNIIKLAKSWLFNICQDSFDKILSQQLTPDRSYMGYLKIKYKVNKTLNELAIFCQA